MSYNPGFDRARLTSIDLRLTGIYYLLFISYPTSNNII